MRVTLKTLRLLPHLVFGLLLCAYTAFDRHGRWLRRERLTSFWNRRLLRILDIELSVHGRPDPAARILVANHVSWLDIPVIAARREVRFVSKAEVREWPLAGWLATCAGTFYLRRGAGGTKQLTVAIDEYLKDGAVVFFPEGTTTDGHSVLRFQPRLFATAIDTASPVQPVALRYRNAADGGNIGPFVGDDDMVRHIIRLMQRGPLQVELHFCPAIDPAGHDRASLALATQTAVCRVVAPKQLFGDASVGASRQTQTPAQAASQSLAA